MTVRERLILTLTGVVVLLLAPALYGVSRLAEVRNIAFEQRGRHAAAFLALGRLQAALGELDRFERSYIAAPDPELRAGVDSALTAARTQLSRLGDAGYGETAAVVGTRLDSLEAAAQRVDTLVQAGRVEEATAFYERIKPGLDRTQRELDRVATAIDRRSLADLRQAQQISAGATTSTLAAMVVSLSLALALGGWTTRALTRPLRRLSAATATVAGGDFQRPQRLPYDRPDEIGDLARSFGTMTDRLAELDRLRAEFVGIISHDLKTPINVIGGYAELIEEGIYGEVGDQQREAVTAIREQTESLTRLVNQLLDISRFEAGALEIELGDVELAALLDTVRRSFSSMATRQGIDFAVEQDPSLPEMIAADADRLRDQVLGNLLSNAFKFTPEGGRIRLRAWAEDGSVRLEVSDTGPGIPAEDLPSIFEKFYQVEGKARARGAGLGLAIAREVVHAHDGRIDVESELGRGTTFRITLPVRPSRAVPRAA